MTTYTATLVRVEFKSPRDELPGLYLRLTWPNPPIPRVLLGFDSLHINKERLALVASALSAAAGAENYLLIGRQAVRLEVDRKRYVTAITFLNSGKRVDIRHLFRGCKQADDGGDVPPC